VRQGRRRASRGVARRNAKLKVLRDLVGKDRAIVAVDLASQRQAAVVCDHGSVVLARRMFRGSAWCISEILAWAGPVAAKAGFAGVVLTCEPTGHRWQPLVVTARARKIPVVCVQPLLVRRAREGEDFTRGRSDFGGRGDHRTADSGAALLSAVLARGPVGAAASSGCPAGRAGQACCCLP